LNDATNLSVGGDVKGFIALGRCVDIEVGTPVHRELQKENQA
jgi:hypothetical protein